MRRAMVRVGLAFLEDLLRGRWPVGGCTWTDAPSDLRVISVAHPPAGFDHLWFYAIVESAAFEPVKPGACLPEIATFTYRSAPP